MKKLINRFTSILCLPAALFWLGFYSLTKNVKEKQFYAMFTAFILNTIKTGEFEGPESYMSKRVYP